MAAIQQGLGITALALHRMPAMPNVLKAGSATHLGKVNICLFNQNTQHPVVSRTLADFIKSRLQG